MSGKKIMVKIVENSNSGDQRFELEFLNVPYVMFPYKDWCKTGPETNGFLKGFFSSEDLSEVHVVGPLSATGGHMIDSKDQSDYSKGYHNGQACRRRLGEMVKKELPTLPIIYAA